MTLCLKKKKKKNCGGKRYTRYGYSSLTLLKATLSSVIKNTLASVKIIFIPLNDSAYSI